MSIRARTLVIAVAAAAFPVSVPLATTLAHATVTLTDPLDDWSRTAAHSVNLTLDSTNPGFFGGDVSRVKRTQNTLESFSYSRSSISDYSIIVYYMNPSGSSPTGTVDVLISPDGATWSYVPSATSEPVAGGGDWYRVTYTPGSALPAGTDHLKVNIANDANVFTPQIGQVTLTHEPEPGPSCPSDSPLADVVGITHVDGRYHFTTEDYLNEGADEIAATCSRIIKLWFTEKPYEDYPHNATWPSFTNFVELAETSYFQDVFTRSQFKVFVLTAYPVGDAEWKDGLTQEEATSVKEKFYTFARYLLTTPAYAGKTFVLQNWEGDNGIEGNYSQVRVEGMINWLNARQDGISQARAEVGGGGGGQVYGAVEANLVDEARVGAGSRFVDLVVPHTHADLYSYSAWDHLNNPARLRANLDYLKARAPDSATFGAGNVMVGEIGAPQLREDVQTAQRQRDYTHALIRAAVQWGARYVLYWQVYDNEPDKGFWIRDEAGNRPPVWQFFRDILTTGEFPAAPPAPPPGPAVLTDDLDSFLYADEMSVNLMFDWANPSFFGGDLWRAKRTADTDDWVQYAEPNITGFAVRTHVEGLDPTGMFAFEVSANGTSWMAIPVVHDPPAPSGPWSSVTFRPAGSVPSGTNYLRVHLKNNPSVYAPQLGQVVINYIQPD